MSGAIGITRYPVSQEYKDSHPSMEEAFDRAAKTKVSKPKESQPVKKTKK